MGIDGIHSKLWERDPPCGSQNDAGDRGPARLAIPWETWFLLDDYVDWPTVREEGMTDVVLLGMGLKPRPGSVPRNLWKCAGTSCSHRS